MNRKTALLLALVGGTVVLLGHAVGQPPPRGAGRPGGPPGRNAPRGSERLLDDLNLSRRERDKAHDALFAYDEAVRQATEAARKDLLAKMKEILPEPEYKTFQSELAGVPLVAAVPNGPRGVAEDDLVTRLMAFDKDGKDFVTKDQLPERMHALFDRGDKNKDGKLDADEAKQLAADQGQAPPPGRGARGGQGPPPGAGRGGRGPGG